MLMMARPRRELSIPQRAQFAAEDLFGDRQAVFSENPLRKIDEPPAYDLMNRRDRTGLDHGEECAPLFVIEYRGTPGRRAVDEPIRPLGIEPKNPIANGLEPDPAEPSRVSPRAPIINRDESEEAPRNASRLLRKSQSQKHRPIKLIFYSSEAAAPLTH
jgi:hypothetical protein